MINEKQANILHSFSKNKNKVTDKSTNTLLVNDLINESEHSQVFSDIIRKNIQIGRENKKT